LIGKRHLLARSGDLSYRRAADAAGIPALGCLPLKSPAISPVSGKMVAAGCRGSRRSTAPSR